METIFKFWKIIRKKDEKRLKIEKKRKVTKGKGQSR